MWVRLPDVCGRPAHEFRPPPEQNQCRRGAIGPGFNSAIDAPAMSASRDHCRRGGAERAVPAAPYLAGQLAAASVTPQPSEDRWACGHLRRGSDLAVRHLDCPDRAPDATEVLDVGDLLVAEVLGPRALWSV